MIHVMVFLIGVIILSAVRIILNKRSRCRYNEDLYETDLIDERFIEPKPTTADFILSSVIIMAVLSLLWIFLGGCYD